MSKRVTALQASVPSGESVGVPMRWMAQRDSTDSGGLRCAERRGARRGGGGGGVSYWGRDAADSGGLRCAERRVAPRGERGIVESLWVQCGVRDSNLPSAAPSALAAPSSGRSDQICDELPQPRQLRPQGQRTLVRVVAHLRQPDGRGRAGVNFFDNAEVYAKGESERIM